jgi:gas vesicle protein
VVEEAGQMTPEKIEKVKNKIEEWESLVAEKEAELKEVTEKLAQMSPADLAGEEAKSLKEQSDKATDYISDVKEKIESATTMLAECGAE